jgi:hypothetical protein
VRATQARAKRKRGSAKYQAKRAASKKGEAGSGVTYFRLIEVNKMTPSVRVGSRWTEIHDEQVRIAIFEHMSQFRVHEAELLIPRIPSNLHDKHLAPLSHSLFSPAIQCPLVRRTWVGFANLLLRVVVQR